jgi:hypothetical protein
MQTKLLFGGMIAIILLGLYSYAAWFGVAVTNCVSNPDCTRLTRESFTSGMVLALSLIGGLVSALGVSSQLSPPSTSASGPSLALQLSSSARCSIRAFSNP